MHLSPFEIHATIKQHEQDLQREAERDRLLRAKPVEISWLEHVLARTGRLLIAIGTRLETRYAKATPVPAPAFRANGSR